MYKIAFYNKKGGTGKTTISIEIATILSKMKYRTLLLDGDSQQDSSFFFTRNEENNLDNVLFNKRNVEDEIITINDYLDILKVKDFIEIDNFLYKKGANFLNSIIDPLQYDFIIIDCSPSISNLNNKLLELANEIILVTVPELLSLKALDTVYKDFKDKIDIILVNKYKKNKEHTEVLEMLQGVFKNKKIILIKDTIKVSRYTRKKLSILKSDKSIEKEILGMIKEIIRKWLKAKI